ncbi:hypothetical protein [Thermus filiformis]|jgi:hypothetical protein|uniref:Uncharacterized protein n=1 Tax=Thermus filiformis TaxID=276 RepID=A0A0D6X9B8_THEFI|nr:hypothetical protein [Thermus filiformis]KIX84355.1 hypothetical protein THFILI_09375 [Thermus filiformis]
MRAVLPLSVALALGLLVFAASSFTPLGGVLALALGGLGGAGVYAWQARLVRGGLGPAARERLAFKEAWRRGGRLTPEDLAPFLPEAEARALLEDLCRRGFCRREGEGYRFDEARKR